MNKKKIALITGANKGIGLETARQLGKQDITVLLGARDSKKGNAAAEALRKDGIDAHSIVIDVSNLESIRKAANQVERDFGRLDILINNAGVMMDERTKKVSGQSLDTWRATFDTNVFGLIATTNAFLPLLRKSEGGRVVNLSSILGSIEFHAKPGSPIYESKDTPAYNVSKAAVNAYTVQLAHELKETGIKVNAAHPGWVKTDMGGSEAPLTPEQGADTIVWLATLPKGGPTGSFFRERERIEW